MGKQWEMKGQGDRYLIRDGHKTTSVAMVLLRDGDVEDCIKRARLIAAAPDMLAALKIAQAQLHALTDSIYDAGKAKIDAAIAKATSH